MIKPLKLKYGRLGKSREQWGYIVMIMTLVAAFGCAEILGMSMPTPVAPLQIFCDPIGQMTSYVIRTSWLSVA
ncbi:hypothetical protein [Alicyclobacillus fastidiosus]|uniref:Uncharacterized protein n=1 Tax=Alicyclobacillus fastidiosus TaxID=392011 RepID=A0ABV5AKC9_9BACL|nr:hypothetical protein [Alicyclobacillus fastidiosus]WEH08024.1 hypothetical protein PYS47_14835 [Alicyclobacillus fastidiosus]